MKRPNRPDADAHRVRGDYRDVAAARQQTLHLFVVCIRKRPILGNTGMAGHLNDES